METEKLQGKNVDKKQCYLFVTLISLVVSELGEFIGVFAILRPKNYIIANAGSNAKIINYIRKKSFRT